MINVTFEDVRVIDAPDDYYLCSSAMGVATGTTDPVPYCFKDMTD